MNKKILKIKEIMKKLKYTFETKQEEKTYFKEYENKQV